MCVNSVAWTPSQIHVPSSMFSSLLNLSVLESFFFAFCGIFPYLGLEKSMEIHTVGLDIHSIIDSLFGQENLTKVDI